MACLHGRPRPGDVAARHEAKLEKAKQLLVESRVPLGEIPGLSASSRPPTSPASSSAAPGCPCASGAGVSDIARGTARTHLSARYGI